MAPLAQSIEPSPAPGHLRVVAGRTGPRPGLLATRRRRGTALMLLLAAATALYTVGLPASGWANSYYAAAAQAGAQSWRAMLFGGLDPSGGITVDKPPAALWLIDVSVRLFGLSPTAILLPQALAGVAAVALLHATVRRQALSLEGDASLGRRAPERLRAAADGREARAAAIGLLAAAALAVTPVATPMPRYDDPDELMLLLLVGAAYALTRSIEAPAAGGSWLALSGALLGSAFLTKMLQAWLVLPAFFAVALLAGAGSLGRRVARTSVAGVVLLATAGWWIAVVQLTPAAQRPWVGGTQGNSVLELALGYNGVGRLTGHEADGGATNVPQSGSWLRQVSTWGPEAGWLLPAAAVALLAAAVLTRGRDRRDPLRAGLLLWGAWLVMVTLVLGSLRGIAHGYYTVQLAPAIAASLAFGSAVLWQRSWGTVGVRWPRVMLIVGLLGNAAWGTLLAVHRHASPPVLPARASHPTVAGGRPLPRRHVGHQPRRAMRPTADSDRVPVVTWLRSVVRPRPSDRIVPGMGLSPVGRDNGRVGNGPDRPRRPLGRPAMVISVLAAAWITTGCGSSDAAPSGSGPAASAAASSSAEASTAAAEYARNTPPAAARMICDDEIRGEIADALGVGSIPAGQSGWADHIYTCTYAPPMGQLVLSVTVAPSDAAAHKALAGMRSGLPNAAPDSGLGEESYRSDAGTVVAVKDNMVLRVDATGMPDDLGTVHERRVDLARTVAGGVFNCWIGNS